jgi:hypothetical protein
MKHLSRFILAIACFLSMDFCQPLTAQMNHNLFIGSDVEKLFFQTAELNLGWRLRHSFQVDFSIGYQFNRSRRKVDFVPVNKERGSYWEAGISFYPRISGSGVLRLVTGAKFVQSFWNHRWEVKIPYYYGEYQDAGSAKGTQQGLSFPLGMEIQKMHTYIQLGMELNFFNGRPDDEFTSRGYYSPAFGGISKRDIARGNNVWLFFKFGWFIGSSFMDS